MYNYRKFKIKEYDLIHSNGIQVGELLPEFEVLTYSGERKKTTDFLTKPVILETGSITCGMFAGQIKAMEALAKENEDYVFLILYVREAHPGRKILPHQSIDSKCDLACRLKEEEQLQRSIIIDDLDGSLHKKLGGLPNMVFIISTEGKIVYKADWNKTEILGKAIEKLRVESDPIKGKWSFLPMPSIRAEHKVFKRAGWDAAIDLIAALPGLIYQHLMEGVCAKYPVFCKE